jgi:hypothetical protein
VLVTLCCACGGSGRSVLAPATPAPSPQPTVKPYVRDEEPPPRIATGRVTTQVVASCSLSTVDAVIRASYRADVAGPDTVLRNVRLMLNNKPADDSGDIYATSYEKDVMLHVASGANYTLIVTYIATNAVGPQIVNIVGCPKAPGAGA